MFRYRKNQLMEIYSLTKYRQNKGKRLFESQTLSQKKDQLEVTENPTNNEWK